MTASRLLSLLVLGAVLAGCAAGAAPQQSSTLSCGSFEACDRLWRPQR